ncbi:MAG: alanine--glyoxylate aminotransferase family protein, partial [Bacillota bacterium]|nr:alanine--glyoxylate aminotransferase family protein [Bacillota bacterium]
VLVLVTGEFGDRFARICQAYGAEVDRIDVPWGEAVPVAEVERRLAAKQYRAVYATHNETSTGVVNDVAAIGRLVAGTEALFVVDTVSSLGGMEFRADAWHCDLVVTGSQKALMLPPGMTLVSVSPKAWPVIEAARSPRFYFDLRKYRQSAEKNEVPFTPAVSLLFGLDEALAMLREEGLERAWARHALMARMVRAAARALGLELLAADAVASATVTAVKGPAGVSCDELRSLVKKKYGLVLAGGQGPLKGKIFRIGHLGFADPPDMLSVVAALELGLAELGHPVNLGQGVGAAERELLAAVR